MELYDKIAEQIISEQEKIIGPVAVEQARQVPGVTVNWDKHEVKIEGDQKKAIEAIIGRYQELFGKVAIEVCRQAVKSLISSTTKDQIPQVLL